MYKNIVFDIGGVVINYDPKEFLVDRFFHERTEKKIYEAVFDSEEWQMLDRDELSWPKARKIFSTRGKEKDVSFEMEAVLDDWQEMLTTRNAAVALIRLLRKKGYHLYYLSNMAKHTFEYLQKRDFWRLFEGGVASFQVKTGKPDIQFYKILLEKYALAPEETIFIDDNKTNVAAAFEAGITGVHFINIKDFVKKLADYGIDL